MTITNDPCAFLSPPPHLLISRSSRRCEGGWPTPSGWMLDGERKGVCYSALSFLSDFNSPSDDRYRSATRR
jgi:hypothetical protein